MRFRMGFRFTAISAISGSIITSIAILICAVTPSMVRADSLKFVASDHGDAFEAAAVASAQSSKPTIAKRKLPEAGLVAEDSLFTFQPAMALSRRSSSAAGSADLSGASNSSEARLPANGTGTFDAVSNQNLASDSTDLTAASQWPVSFYGAGGPFFYLGAPTASSGQTNIGSNPIDLGIGQSGNSDLNSSGGPGSRHNGVVPRIMWPIRIFTGEPAPVPEPSSLVLLGCGIFALGLKQKFHSAK